MSRRPPGGPKTWSRTNHRGEPVTLLEGPAVAAGALAAVLARAGLAQASGSPGSPGAPGWRRAAAVVLGGAGAAAFGAYDDLAGSGDRRGFRGHLGALRQGEVTTGAVKLGGIGVTGVVSAALAGASAAGLSRPARIALLAGIAGLTAASEKVSFTKVIARTPALNWLDMLGRRPAPQPPAPQPPLVMI